MGLREKIEEKALEVVRNKFFEDIFNVSCEDNIDYLANLYASAKYAGFSVVILYSDDIEELEKQGWDISELSFKVTRSLAEVYLVDITAPNGKSTRVRVVVNTVMTSKLSKEEWRKYSKYVEEYKDKVVSYVLKDCREKLAKAKSEIDSLRKELEKCKDKLVECGCEA